VISEEVKLEILACLSDIEIDEGVTIFYACESGSRAWGFPSADSDYDVRFLYLRPSDWYLSIDLEAKRDVIERPINEMLDISGWDLRKALQLFRKSNPPLLEWLNSPIVYQEKFSVSQQLRDLIPAYYSRVKCMHHYLHMAQGNFREYLRGDIVWVKKYFYVLRPILAIKWIETQTEVVPMEFGKLVESCVESRELKTSINTLLARKMAGQELDRQPRIDIISEFIESELQRLESVIVEDKVKPDSEKLNQLFRSSLGQ
jgi:uncharacterized protein